MKQINKFILILFLSLSFFSCSKNKDTSTKVNIYTVKSAPVEKGDLKNYFKLCGEIITKINIDAQPDVNYGKITQLNVDVGDYVYKGQILALVDPSLPGQQYNLSPVRSPISGVITQRKGQIGMTVNTQTGIYKIGDMSKTQFLTSIPERYISKIYNGQTASIVFEAFPAKTFTAKVVEISPILDTTSRTMDVWFNFDKFTKELKPGMFGTIQVYTDFKKNVLKVSSDYVLTRFNERFVYILSKEKFEINNPEYDAKKNKNVKPILLLNKAEKRIVTEGIRVDGFVEITSGISVGDNLIIQGHSLLEDGVYVRLYDDILAETENNETQSKESQKDEE